MLAYISLNVPDIRRFGGCDKGMRSIPTTDKMWWKKTAQRAISPTAVFWNPKAANSRRSVYRLLYAVCHFVDNAYTILLAST